MTFTYCPECGGHTLTIEVAKNALVVFSPDTPNEWEVEEIGGDTEWGGLSSTTCADCGFEGNLCEFQTDERSLGGETSSPERQSNEEFIADLMSFSKSGP